MSKKPQFVVPKPGAKLSFSFQHLDLTRAKYNPHTAKCDHAYFCAVLGKMAALSQMTRDQFVALPANGGKAWRVHRIEWVVDQRLTDKTFGMKPELTADENAWQFTVSLNQGRIHGFLIDSIFFVRWFDPDHELYGKDPDS